MEPKGGGLILLLYSIVLSKGFDEAEEDLQDHKDVPLVRQDDTVRRFLYFTSPTSR